MIPTRSNTTLMTKNVNEGIYRDLDLCKFLLEDLENYFSKDVLVDRVTNAISEYISDDEDTYENIKLFLYFKFEM